MGKEGVDKPEQNMTAKRLQTLYELIERMNSVYELQELLDFVVDRTLQLTGGRHGLLLLSDSPQEPTLDQVAVVRGQNLSSADMTEPLKLVSTTVIKDTLKRGEPQLVVDLRVDERFSTMASHNTHQLKRVRSVLAVPLKIESQYVGLIYVDHPKQGVFGQDDLDFLRAFANQAAIAIFRTREHQRQIDELTLLNAIGHSVVQVLDLDEVLTRIVYEATEILSVESGSVIMVDEETSELVFATAISNGHRIDIPTRLNWNQGIAGWVIANNEAACVSNVSADERWFGEVETGFNFQTHSLLCVPLQIHGRVLGALEVFNKKRPGGFGSSDVTRLSAFASSATIAIENARLFQEARQAHQLRSLNEVALALSSTLDLEMILNLGIEHTTRILRGSASAISFTDKQVHLPPVQVSQGFLSTDPSTAEAQMKELSHIADLVLKTNNSEPLIIDSLHPWPNIARHRLEESGVNALAVAPIKVGDKVSGALLVMKKPAQPYDSNEISLITSIARIIGLAAQNAIHFNQARSQTLRLTYLSEVGTALTGTLDLQHVLEVIIEGVNSLLETERTSVFLIDQDTNELVLQYSNQGDADIRLPAPWKGIAGWVATHDQPALVNDAGSDPRHLFEIADKTGYQAHSILCVPLKVEDQVIGVVEVLNTASKQRFTQEHQGLLTELTRWASIAIQNARLFDERVRAYKSLASEQERRVAAETRGAMASVILDMAHTMNNVVGALRVWAQKIERAAEMSPDLPIGSFVKETMQIRQNAEEAISLISSMTDPLKQAEHAATDVHLCLAEAIKNCWRPDNIQIHYEYGDNVPLVLANGKRLEAAFNNIISNAVQAMDDTPGNIVIRTLRTDDGWAQVSIKDDGRGIPPEIQKNLFTPQISSKSRGLGIGLWLVETFINQFGGKIDFESGPEIGTEFIVTLQPAQSIASLVSNGEGSELPSRRYQL